MTATGLDIASGAKLVIELDGTAGPGVAGGHDQVDVAGSVTLQAGALLEVTANYTPVVGDSFQIVQNDDVDPVNGEFAGLAEGTSFLVPGPGGTQIGMTISYAGSNDIVLTAGNHAEVYVDDDWAGTDVGTDPDDDGPALSFGYDSFATIQDAITAVVEAGTVYVADGVYTGQVTVDKTVTIAGANAGVPAGVDPGTRAAESVLTGGFVLSADDVVIDGFTVVDGTGPGGIGSQTAVFMTSGSDGHTIQNNILDGPGTGSETRGILTTFNGNNHDLTIRDNEFFDWKGGIFNQGNSNVNIAGNDFHDLFAGVSNDFVSDVAIEGNAFASATEGIGVYHNVTNSVPDIAASGNSFSATVTSPIAHYGGDTRATRGPALTATV
jgi:hypothetical protein